MTNSGDEHCVVMARHIAPACCVSMVQSVPDTQQPELYKKAAGSDNFLIF
jgi:hypothetical protein